MVAERAKWLSTVILVRAASGPEMIPDIIEGFLLKRGSRRHDVP
jgi:hypothetical protein